MDLADAEYYHWGIHGQLCISEHTYYQNQIKEIHTVGIKGNTLTAKEEEKC